MLSIEGLTKHFGTHTAVADFSLHMKESEFVTLLGPSGSGKTTVLRMVAGLLSPSGGSIRIGDLDVTHMNPQSRNIGLVFQSYALFPNMTAWDNVAFPLRVRRWKSDEIRARVDSLLDMVGLSHRAKFYPDSLSGGERQRTALARALAFHPPLLLLDEPLSALDAKVRQGLRASLKDIQRTTGVTTLMVTHDQEEALELSDRIVVMSQGKVEQIGSSDDIYYRPQTSFTANFIGEVNAIEAVVKELGHGMAKLRFQGLEFDWPLPSVDGSAEGEGSAEGSAEGQGADAGATHDGSAESDADGAGTRDGSGEGAVMSTGRASALAADSMDAAAAHGNGRMGPGYGGSVGKPGGRPGWKRGETVTLYIRPESVEIAEVRRAGMEQGERERSGIEQISTADPGVASATVVASTFAGALTHVTVRVGEATLGAYVLSSKARALNPGSDVLVRIVAPVVAEGEGSASASGER